MEKEQEALINAFAEEREERERQEDHLRMKLKVRDMLINVDSSISLVLCLRNI